jgi:hypothetical protein
MVKNGVPPDWIDGHPTEAADYTRRERYAGAMHGGMQRAIREEEEKHVIERIPPEEAPYVMPAFQISKANGKVRLILDCRCINIFIKERRFKMADWLQLKRQVRRRMFGITIDLSSAFHHLGVAWALRRLLCFRYDSITYRYIGLPFGLRSAPRLFCAAMGATMNAIRARWNVLASAYMDDLIILHVDPAYLRRVGQEIVAFLEWLGWSPNMQKCKLEPATRFVYLGMQWDTEEMSIRMTSEKNTALKKTIKRWIGWTAGGAIVRARDVARLIGQLSATRAQHESASLYLARLNRLKCQAVGANGGATRTQLTRALLPELH